MALLTFLFVIICIGSAQEKLVNDEKWASLSKGYTFLIIFNGLNLANALKSRLLLKQLVVLHPISLPIVSIIMMRK